jgi:hypothetical protein
MVKRKTHELREVGKRYVVVEETFLKNTAINASDHALRYVIERFPAAKRELFMKDEI